jgi:hypothetical protein
VNSRALLQQLVQLAVPRELAMLGKRPVVQQAVLLLESKEQAVQVLTVRLQLALETKYLDQANQAQVSIQESQVQECRHEELLPLDPVDSLDHLDNWEDPIRLDLAVPSFHQDPN